MSGLSYDQCLPKAKERLQGRMKWVWTEDVDEAYEKYRTDLIAGGEFHASGDGVCTRFARGGSRCPPTEAMSLLERI